MNRQVIVFILFSLIIDAISFVHLTPLGPDRLGPDSPPHYPWIRFGPGWLAVVPSQSVLSPRQIEHVVREWYKVVLPTFLGRTYCLRRARENLLPPACSEGLLPPTCSGELTPRQRTDETPFRFLSETFQLDRSPRFTNPTRLRLHISCPRVSVSVDNPVGGENLPDSNVDIDIGEVV